MSIEPNPNPPAALPARRRSSSALVAAQAMVLLLAGAGAGLGVNYRPLTSGELMSLLDEGPGKQDTYKTMALDRAVSQFKRGSAIFIDVRTRARYMAGHIPGAINMERTKFDEVIGQVSDWLPMDTVLITYGRAGEFTDARSVADWLGDLGCKERYVLSAGLEGWIERGHPVATGAETVWNQP